jgi:hypothetical protein
VESGVRASDWLQEMVVPPIRTSGRIEGKSWHRCCRRGTGSGGVGSGTEAVENHGGGGSGGGSADPNPAGE